MHATDFVESYMDAWNDRDPEGIADHLAAGGIVHDVPENTLRTRDELIVSLKRFFSEYRHRYELIGEILAGQKTIAYEYRMVPSDGGQPGRSSGTYYGAEFVTMEHDAALTIVDYYDIPGIDRSGDIAGLTTGRTHNRKYAKSGLDQQQLLAYKARLAEIMRSHKAYLRSDLTLPKLAHMVGSSVNHLSQVINAGFGMSFFDYLNQYRIDYAKDLLQSTDSERSAILNIAYTVGFNSNSAFYAAFKKRVGQSPARYRRDQLHRLLRN